MTDQTWEGKEKKQSQKTRKSKHPKDHKTKALLNQSLFRILERAKILPTTNNNLNPTKLDIMNRLGEPKMS